MSKSRNDAVRLGRRRQEVAELYVECWTQTRIAQHLGVTQSTVSNDLKMIQKEWKESRIRDLNAARELELRRIDRLEREAWEAWKRSQEPLESTRVLSDGSGAKKAQKNVKHRDGDPRFLEQIHKCISSRRALLGLDAPSKIAPTSPDGQESYHSHVMSELMKMAERAGGGPEVVDAEFVSGVAAKNRIEGDIEEAGNADRNDR